MIINVDSDGVVYDMVRILKGRLEEKLGRDLPTPDSWHFDNWGFPQQDLFGVFEDEARHNLFGLGGSIPGAVPGIFSLLDTGHQVRIVTNKSLMALGKGSKNAMQDVVQWYYGQGLLGAIDLVFTHGNKHGYPADVVIDDKPDMGWAQKDAVNVLFDQPWNQYLTGKAEHESIWIRAMDWQEVLEVVEQMGGGILIDKDRSPVVV